MGLILTSAFDDRFLTDPDQDPLNPASWDQDLDTADNGTLEVSSGQCQCDVASLANQAQAAQWWKGNAPANCFVQVTIGNLENQNQSTLRVFYRGVAQDNGFKLGCYQAGINATSGAIVIESRGTGGGPVGSCTGLKIVSGDVLTFAVVGTTHYVYQNGVQIGKFTDSKYSAGGPGTAGIGAVPANNVGDASFADFKVGSATEVHFLLLEPTTGPSLVSWD